MAKNKIQFQQGLSLLEFFASYGTKDIFIGIFPSFVIDSTGALIFAS